MSFVKGTREMACRAFLFKSFAIYRTTYLATIFEIIWPCLIIYAILILRSINHTPDGDTPAPQVGTPYSYDYINDQSDLSSSPSSSFLKKVHATHNPQYEISRVEDDPLWDEASKKICSLQYSFFFILCFYTAWTAASTLSHAERMSGTVERMRMYGISDFQIVFSYVVHAALKQTVSNLLVTIMLKTNIKGPPLIEDLDYLPVFLTISLLNLHTSSYFLALASFFNSAVLRSMVGGATYFYLFLWGTGQSFSVLAQVFGNMVAPFCLTITMRTACGFQSNGGVTLESLLYTNNDTNDLPLLVVAFLVMTGSAFSLFIFFYMLNVKPGPYGSAKPFYFILTPGLQENLISFLRLKLMKSKSYENFENIRQGLYEKVPENIDIGIRIKNLFKTFGNVLSVKNLSLDIYSGQITALLGHNGAGKTTTLSILAGMISPTSGSATYLGYNIFSNLRKFRKDLGLCPQNNLLHPNLNVIDQLIFFGMLSGLSMNEAKYNATNVLRVVGISEKMSATVKQLSGGMQRKLCIALSLVGNPKVVILDEPTSGVDPESRREIWNVLLESRGERIIIITTHFMEEADALGDQIAIMNHGEIVCYGSPLFLKKHYGAGYHISLTSDLRNFPRFIQTVKSFIPEASVISEQEELIKFKLPFHSAKNFPDLFQTLESDVDISQIIIGCTTMEDVYLKVEEEAGGEIATLPKHSVERVTETYTKNMASHFNRFLGLINKNMIRSYKMWFKNLLIVGVLPIIVAYITMNQLYIDYNAYQNITNDRNSVGGSDRISKNNDQDKFIPSTKGYLRSTAESPEFYNFYDTQMDCKPDMFLEMRVYIFTLWISYVLFMVSTTFAPSVLTERVSSLKHLILITGTSPVTYNLSNILWDSVVYLIFVIMSWITLIILDPSHYFERESGIYVLFLILFLSGVSMIGSVYFVTLLFQTTRGVVIFYSAGIFTLGFISFFIVPIEAAQPYAEILKLQPLTSAMLAIQYFISAAVKKHSCRECYYKGCDEIISAPYLSDENLLNSLLMLCADFLLFLVLVILTDYGLFPYIWNKIYSIYIGGVDTTELSEVDSDVAREKNRVGTVNSSSDFEDVRMVTVDGLAKKYSRSMVAVHDVTFAIEKGECFGLLGVNGAGKSTTFNMLTGSLYPTRGNIFIKGYPFNDQKAKCLSLIGYCPQHSALEENLTGRQMLKLFAKLRFVPSHSVNKEVDKWISLLGLQEYCDRPCGTYSGGNKRKLSTAIAFIGDPSVILLDEPTTGVDPFIRRNLWNVIHACNNTDQAIIISSHSMDECEAVCDRLTIMAKGRMECIGNTQHLKALYGSGYVIMIKLKVHSEEERVVLKNTMQSTFASNCVLKDEHQVLLHYHLGTNVFKLWQLFRLMEQIKGEFPFIDDYIITNSSLEEVFLSFAKKTNG